MKSTASSRGQISFLISPQQHLMHHKTYETLPKVNQEKKRKPPYLNSNIDANLLTPSPIPIGISSIFYKFIFRLNTTSKPITIHLHYLNWSKFASQNRRVSFANRKWEMCIPPPSRPSTLKPIINPPCSAFDIWQLKASVTIKKR